MKTNVLEQTRILMLLNNLDLFNDFDWSNPQETIKIALNEYKSNDKVKDIFDYVETWGNFNKSDIDEADQLDEEEQKMFDDF